MHKKNGFTLIELMLSMTFISFLLIMIAVFTIQITNIYTKGTTLKAVNQAGGDISAELTTSLNQASQDQVVIVDNMIVDGKVEAGRLCSGRYSYVWNYGVVLNASQQTGANQYGSGTNQFDIRFVKVPDPAGTLCTPVDGNYPKIDRSKATELLAEGDRNVAVQGLTIEPNQLSNTGQTIYSINLVLGTNNSNQYIEGQNTCKPPTEALD